MNVVYTLSKFVHVSAVIVWLGGQVAIAVINARLARTHDPTQMAPLTRASRFFGTAIAGPAAGLTLIAGIVMMATAQLSFADLWIAWGLRTLGVVNLLILFSAVWAMVFKPTL